MSQANADPEPGPKKPAAPRIVKAFFYSAAGFRSAYTGEAAFREEVWVSLILGVISWFLQISLSQHLALVGSLIFVLLVELLNSAIEASVDHTSLEFHPMAKCAKDMGSAAVLLSLVLALMVWVGVLWA